MAQKDIVALGLSAAVVVGLLLLRKPAEPTPKGGTEGPGFDPNVAQARTLITTIESQITANTTQAQREGLATQLEMAAGGLAGTSPQAAQELRDAAMRIRMPGGMMNPTPNPNPNPGPGPTPAPTLLDRFQSLRQKVEDYLAGKTGATLDPMTLAEMDRTAVELQKAGYGQQADILTALAAAGYAATKTQRPMGLTL